MTAFEILNAYRVNAGQKPLKAWKESKEKLANAIAKARAAAPDFDPRVGDAKARLIAAQIEQGTDLPDMGEYVPGHSGPAKKEIAKANGATITLAEVARELGMNPKVARAKARRKNFDDGQGWTFPASRKDDIIAFLKS